MAKRRDRARKVTNDEAYRKYRVQRDSGIKVRAYELMDRCVEDGVEMGWNRAHKHGKPDEAQLKAAIADAVMSEVAEWFEFFDKEE